MRPEPPRREPFMAMVIAALWWLGGVVVLITVLAGLTWLVQRLTT